MDGRQTQERSVWLATAEAPVFPPLRGDVTVDVAIVGGGITGLTAAALLAEAGRTVAVLEARRLGSGVTGHTTAHLDWSTDAGPAELVAKCGDSGARIVLGSGQQAIDLIAAWVERYQLTCDFRRVDGYYFTESEGDLPELEQEAGTARHLGFEAELVRPAPLPFPAPGAVRYGGEGRLHSLRYLYGLAGAVAGDRCRIYEMTRATGVEEGTPCRVATERGRVLARKVVLATHSPLGLRVAIQTRVAPYRSYVLGVRLDHPFPEGIYFDNVDPYHYLRRFSADDPSLLLVGGGDHKTGQSEDTNESFRVLEDYTARRFGPHPIEYRWSGQVFIPVDDLPLVGLDVGSEHTYVATGYAGNGITFGTFAGMLIADEILDRPNPAAGLFTPRRANPAASARKFVSENLNVARQYVTDWLTSGPREAIELIPAGEGRLVQVGGRKIAVYRDPEGRIHKLSPVCPHAKCIVRWNTAEKSWDCPCHGSRFRATGEPLDAPAAQGLERIEE